MFLVVPQLSNEGSHVWFQLHELSHRTHQTYPLNFWGGRWCKYRIIGTSRGWLMTVCGLSRVQALDPFSYTWLPFPASVVEPGLCFGVYKKAILVPQRPGRGAPLWAAVLRRVQIRRIPEIAFAPVGAAAWTNLTPGGGSCFDDIAADDDGKLYALARTCHVFSFDLRTLEQSSYRPIPPPRAAELEAYPDCQRHLGMIYGELIMVRTWKSEFYPPMFDVFWLDRLLSLEPRWVKITELLGHAILLGDDGFVTLRARENPGLVADCVYWLDSEQIPSRCFIHMVNLRTGARHAIPLSTPFAPWFWFFPEPLAFRFST